MYIYIKGFDKIGSGIPTVYYNKLWKFNFNLEEWSQLTDFPIYKGNGRNGFAVSPIDENLLYCATTSNKVSNDGGITWVNDNDYYTVNGVSKKCPHTDVQDMKFNSSGTEVWAASDGGPFYKNIEEGNPNPEWENKVNDIGIAFVQYFDQSRIDPNYYLFGGYDVHSQLFDRNQETWSDIGAGDGFGCAFDNIDFGTFYATGNGTVFRYIDWQYDDDFTPPGNFWQRHVTINPVDNETIYTASGAAVFRSFNQGDDWELIADNDITDPPIVTQTFYDTHVAEGNGDYLYLRVIGAKSDENPVFHSRIYKTTNVNEVDPENIEWELISNPPGINSWLGDIEVDYENPDIIWACYSGYNGGKVQKYDGTEWTDITYNLANCQNGIKSLAHLHGSDDALFAGGFHNIFYLEEVSSNWKMYKPGIPNVNKGDLKINYCSGKIVSGTKGRGIWETDLPTGWDDAPVITSNETWEGYRIIFNPIYVPTNITLTITGKVDFTANGKIIVEPGGQLIIDDGLLTNTCGDLWQGIEVRGTYNQPQTYAYQGNVKIINGGMIENAVCGIQTIKFDESTGTPDYDYTGGMVWADGAVFRNCRTAAKFWPYDHSLGSSFFRDCEFITNNDLLPGTDPDYFIKTSGLSRLTVMGSSFTDSHTVMDFDGLTSGIESYDTYLRTYSYGSQQCEFTGLYDGIRAYAHNPERTILIKDGIFTNNMRSVYLATIMQATVTGNEFHPLENEPALTQEPIYCMYLDYCNGYTVEENEFLHSGSGPVGKGIVINNSGTNNNELYNNNFTNLVYATLAQNNNRGFFDEVGLTIKCNDYEDNSHDIAVTAEEGVVNPGIAHNQGAVGATSMQAGNRFSLNNNGIDYSDYNSFKEGPILYYHHDPASELRVKPIYYSTTFIDLNNQGTEFLENESCESHLSGGGSGGGIGRDDLTSNMASSGLKADSTQTLLTALVDGGNTEVLQQEVLQTMPQEAYDLYMSLMGKSPYLSDSVLIATIEKEYILPNVLIKDILTANPQAAKSPEVMDKVDEKAIPMTDEQIAEILLGKYIVAAKEKLESQLAYYKHQRSISLKFLKQSYRNDTVDPYVHDSLVYLLETENGLQEKFELVFAYTTQSNWMEAMALLNDLPNQFSFKQHEQQMYDDYNTLINILYELHQAGTGLEGLTAAQNTTLLQLSDNTQNFAGASARNILIKTDSYPYTEPIILPGNGLKSGSITFDLPVPKDYKPEYINIYPNPAMDYIIVELNKTNLNGVNIILYDNGGKLVKQTVIPARTQEYIIGLKGMKPGIYIIKADMDGKDIGGKKFSIIE